MEIHVSKDGQSMGPYSMEQVIQYLDAGYFTISDLAWHEGLSEWVPLEKIVGKGPTPSAIASPSMCKNHSTVTATDRCAGCAEPFCPSCLVEIQGQKYCGACKVMALKKTPVLESATIPCPEAGEALKYAIIGLFCFGIILEPIAISKAVKARKMIALNPQLMGSGKATAALVIAIIGLVLWVLGLIARVSGAAR